LAQIVFGCGAVASTSVGPFADMDLEVGLPPRRTLSSTRMESRRRARLPVAALVMGAAVASYCASSSSTAPAFAASRLAGQETEVQRPRRVGEELRVVSRAMDFPLIFPEPETSQRSKATRVGLGEIASTAWASIGCLAVASLASLKRRRAKDGPSKPLPVSTLRELPGSEAVPRYTAPAPADVSLWHDIGLKATTWLDEDQGVFNFVNEMPRGSLQKFEVQPHLSGNAIEEDPAGSDRLASFGRPVPFNYGCLPQTYRHPEQLDEIYGAPGDDDPLDCLDISDHVRGVGEIVQCRPLGAVCLIDEGQADWKIIVVSTAASDPLAQARTPEDVERIAPGRIQECLQWMDDFKQSRGGDQATLHFEVHGIEQAMHLLEKDHAAWNRLLSETEADGRARGHWIRSPDREPPFFKLPGALERMTRQLTRTPDLVQAREAVLA